MSEYKRVVSLDLLRAFAAYSVAIPHFFIYSGKNVIFENISVAAVEIFFVLSGYVLASQLLLIFNSTEGALRIFLIRRWMRTIPAYLLTLLLVSIVFKQIGSGDFFRYLFYIQNLFYQANSVDYYSVAWSLSVEEWFYVIFPIFMLACIKFTRKRGINFYILFTCLFILIITVLRFSHTSVDSHVWGESVRRVVLFRIDSIAYGFLLFLMLEKFSWKPSVIFGLLGLLSAIAGIMWSLSNMDKSIAQILYPFMAAFLGCFFIIICLSIENTCKHHSLITRTSNVTGQTSYAVYLYHLPVIYLVGSILGSTSLVLRFVVFALGTAALAATSTYLLEQPILQLRPKYHRFRNTSDTESFNQKTIILNSNV